MRTTSPPNIGFAGRFLSDNTSILFVPSTAGVAFMMSPNIVGALNALADLAGLENVSWVSANVHDNWTLSTLAGLHMSSSATEVTLTMLPALRSL
jgi:hypothetical protein